VIFILHGGEHLVEEIFHLLAHFCQGKFLALWVLSQCVEWAGILLVLKQFHLFLPRRWLSNDVVVIRTRPKQGHLA